MRKVFFSLALLFGCLPLMAQQIDLATQVSGLLAPANGGTGLDSSASTGCPQVTSGVWSISLSNCGSGGGGGGAPSGGNFAIQFANGTSFGGANFTGFVFNNGASQPPTMATQAQLFSLLGGTPALLSATAEQDFAGTIGVAGLKLTSLLSTRVLGTNSGGSVIAATVAGAGTGLTTGPTTSVTNNLTSFADNAGTVKDSGVAAANVALLTGGNNFTGGTNTFTSVGITRTGTSDANLIMTADGFTWTMKAVGSNPGSCAATGMLVLDQAGNEYICLFTGSPTGTITLLQPTTVTTLGVATETVTTLTATSLSTNSLKANTTVVNGAGLQIATGAVCATTAVPLNTCVMTITLPVTEPNTSYLVSGCTAADATVAIDTGSIGGRTTTSFALTIIGITSTANSAGTVSCVVTH